MTQWTVLVPGPISGRRSPAAALADARTRLDALGRSHVTVETDSPDQTAAQLAALIAERDVVQVIVLGGDGMVNLAIQSIAGTDVALAIIPLGTGNDTARSLGIPLKDVPAALEIAFGPSTRRVDLGISEGRYFSTVVAAGFDAVVNERANQMRWPKGKSRYTISIIAELTRFKPISYRLEVDGRIIETTAMLVAVANTESQGGGLRVTHGAVIDDGLLDIVYFKAVPIWELLRNYPKLYKGTHVTHPAYRRVQGKSVRVEADGIIAYADGERFGPLPRQIDIAPDALLVHVGAPTTTGHSATA